MELLLEHLAKGFVTMLIISMPCVLTAAAIGLVVGILQAVTQVQEQTIAAAPKILAVFLMIIILGHTFVQMLENYFYESVSIAFNYIPKSESYVLPPEGFSSTKGFMDGKGTKDIEKPSIEEIMKNPGKVPYLGKQDKYSYTKSDQSPSVKPNFVERLKINGR